MISILLQIVQQTAPVTTDAVAPAPAELSLFELMMKGGVIMIPILILWIISLYLFIERFLFLRAVTKVDKTFISNVIRYLKEGDIKSAKLYAAKDQSATGRVIASGLDFVGKPTRDIEAAMESAANIEVAEMERNTGYLGIIAGIAPMLGFVGTIVGIIHIFYDISLSDNISIGIIAGGLYEKMITSGSGLVVGVIAYAAYHLLHQRIQRFSLQLQKDAFEFLRSIH
jgi:biopolymer transport protein ExbB